MDIWKTLDSPVLKGLVRTFTELFTPPAPMERAVAVETGTAETPVQAENAGNITVDGTDDKSLFDYFKADLSQVESDSNRFLSAFAMASLTADPHGDTYRETGNYALLTNDGEIYMNMGELLRRYGSQMVVPGDMESLPNGKSVIRADSGKKYLTIMLWGMLGGNQSRLVNNGRIVMDCDTDNPEGTESVFCHPMYVYRCSSMINNGEVVVRGQGNRGINPRGLTSQKNDLTVINNGSIVIDVEKAYLTRVLTVAGFGSTIINRGLVYGKSEGSVFGAGHTGSSTLINAGTVDVTTFGVIPSERIGVLHTFSSLAGAYGLSVTGADYLMEKLYEKFGVRNWKGEGVSNFGVVKAAVQDTGAADPNSAAAGILVLDSHAPYSGWYTVRNPGVIRVASDILPCEENHYCVKRAELVLNFTHMPEKTFPVKLRVKEWATELRNFGARRDLFLAKTDSDEPVTVSFDDADLILRPPEKYAAGTSFEIRAETLVAPMDAATLEEAGVQVTGMDYLRFRAEMPDFVVPSVTETARGAYQVSLKLADNPEAQQKMLAAAVMAPVDFMRVNLEELDRRLSESGAPDWFGGAYRSRHCRENGLNGEIEGCVGGKDVQTGPLLRAGVHGAFARERASGGIYNADSDMTASMRGVHVSLADGALRAQATRFSTAGGTHFALPTDTGIRLDGKADANLDGVYTSAHLRKRIRLGPDRNIYAEVGVSSLEFRKGTGVDWSFKDEALPGYRMESDAVKSVRGMFRFGWQRRFRGGQDGCASFSLEGSGLLNAASAGLRMLNASFRETVREDPLQISLNASIQKRIGAWKLDMGFQGCLGQKSRRGLFRFSFRPETK